MASYISAKSLFAISVMVLGCIFQPASVPAQGTTAFTYQGQLRDSGTNANGNYTFVFRLYDSALGGTQIGDGIVSTTTLANGLFTVNLDFGAGAFNGSARWLDITVTNGPDAQTLSPRVEVLPAPYAQFAAIAGEVTNHAIMNAQLATNAVGTPNIQNNAITSTQLAADPGSLARVTAGAAYVQGNGMVSFTGGGVNLTYGYGANGTSSWNLENGFSSSTVGGVTAFMDDLFMLGPSRSAALQVFDSPTTGMRGIAAPNISGGAFFGNGAGLTNVSAVPHIQVFRAGGGTFVVPANVTRLMVEMWGAGGAGGLGFHQDAQYDDNGNLISPAIDNGGGGGGAGAYAINTFDVTPGTIYSVVAGNAYSGGNGGDSSFGDLMSAGGGSKGGDANSGSPGGRGVGGASTGSLIPAANEGAQDGNSYGNGGLGGSVWRGGGPYTAGPGGGGSGFNSLGSSVSGAHTGAVVIYY